MHYEGIKNIPYSLRYGQTCRVGLSYTNLPTNLLEQLKEEENLGKATANTPAPNAPASKTEAASEATSAADAEAHLEVVVAVEAETATYTNVSEAPLEAASETNLDGGLYYSY
jgi:hypothetical protein